MRTTVISVSRSLRADARIHHAVGFHRQRPVEVLVVGLEQLEEVGAVAPGAAVEAHAARAQFLADVGMLGLGALEQHVLEQVCHSRLAVVLMARADEVGHVHDDGGLGLIGKQQHAQPVGEPVFGDAFDLGDFHRRGGSGEGLLA
ncbi:MAG: hypothetical protein WDO12_05735 [Pseudomonadota bacterium]